MTADKTPGSGPEAGASSVADEAARLAQAFSAWTQSAPDAGSPEDATGSPEHTPACGCGHGDSVAAVCRMCPVCRAAGLLQAVQPELLDRLADVLGLVASGLHAAAAQRRGDRDTSGGAAPTEAD